ncbi:non-ribosomal peptide synthetase [Nostoc sphaeroides]|uniref:Amino acid adenylation domain protein n=1 Tax=Nostoc sphaeroides CCNUC1 TaxID=2653204 RepID=A0A5P8WI19_9NOSO|nr:non-ribosomal peptide synthetase [Nostoc sphaeroides]QFS52513.1 amino acid adenylation domain protein [Nostoc sphaeroides CCNUC1]
MRTTKDFLAYLKSLDIKVWVEGEQLRCNFPKGILTPTLQAELSDRKAEILQFLAQSSQQPSLDIIRPVSRISNLPMSFAQQRLWFLSQLEAGNATYNVPWIRYFTGQLNIAALKQSLTEILRRHEALRTTFTLADGSPVQIIHPAQPIDFPVINWFSIAKDEQNLKLKDFTNAEIQRPFDLEQGPLLRVTLLQLSPESHVLFVLMHHIVSDGWSMEIFSQELFILYQAFAQGLASPLAELPIQYPDFAVWQRQWLTGEVLEKQLNYWKQQLADAPAQIKLPTDRPWSKLQSFRGATECFYLPSDVAQRLKLLSRKSGTTLFMTLLAGFVILLSRYSYQEDIVVGSPIANRNRGETEKLIGFFVNTLVLRISVADDPSFQDLLARVRKVTLEAQAHQDLPFEKLVEELQPERNLSHSPLFQVLFIFQNAPAEKIELPGLSITSMELDKLFAGVSFDLTLVIEKTETGLRGAFEYNQELFDATTVARMVGHFQTLINAIADSPEERISTLPLLQTSERHHLLVELNNTQIDYPSDQCIHQLFEAQVARTPDEVAVVFQDQQLTYRELNTSANHLAHELRKLNVGPEVLVGICVERTLEMVVELLGILKAGGAYVPLDPLYPTERLAFILEDTQASVLLTQQSLVEKLPQHQARVIYLDTDWQAVKAENTYAPVSGVKPNNLAYLIYTSGSTGKPKGVAIEHRSTVALMDWARQNFSAEQRAGVLASTSICFDLSVFEIFVPLCWGGKVILAENILHLPSLPAVKDVTLINTVPSAIAELHRINGIPATVGTVNLAGEPLPSSLVEQLYKQETIKQVFNLYGPSEDTTYSTYALVKREKSDFSNIGHPIANTQVYILDRHKQPVPIGVLGEIYIGGCGLARGYLNRTELTAQKFILNPFSNQSGSRLYRTGDLARYLPDGSIEYHGRIDYQIKLRGFRIELGEIEIVLNQHPAVQETVVKVWGDELGNKRLIGYIVTEQELAPSVSQLHNFLKERLPEYMMPSTFVFLSNFPLTPNGKIDRHKLPQPDWLRPDLQATYVAPRNQLEKIIATIWQDVLRVDKAGIDDNFFELGGHSLLMIQIHKRLQDILKQDIFMLNMFKYPTISSLAGYLAEDKTKLTPQTNLRVEQIHEGKNRLKQRFNILQNSSSKARE